MKPLVIDLLPLMPIFFQYFQFLLNSVFDCHHDTIRTLDTYRAFFSETCCKFLIQIITFGKKEPIERNVLSLTPHSTVSYKKAEIKNFEKFTNMLSVLYSEY